MRIDSESHRKQLLALLTLSDLSINRDEEHALEQAAENYLSLLQAVRGACVGCACECRANADPDLTSFAHTLAVPEGPDS